MAQSKDNILVQGFSGTISRLLTFMQKGGKTFVNAARKPSEKEPTANQLQLRARFREVTQYAAYAIQDPELKKAYALRARSGQTAYNMAIKDAFRKPQVDKIDIAAYTGLPGDRIVVSATDDFKVAQVKLAIYEANGNLLEEGDAIESAGKWEYIATGLNEPLTGSTVNVTAIDLPGNEGSQELVL